MKIDIITIFPDFFEQFLKTSIIWKAQHYGHVTINIINLRDFSHNKHNKIDDTPYGGGAGMLIQFPPLYDAIHHLKTEDSTVVLLSPQGKVFNQKQAGKLALKKHLIFICGHYEGVDARIESFIDLEISIGDYVLTGGELPAMIISDAVIRLLPEVIESESVQTDSLMTGLLKYAQYTKPEHYLDHSVPSILLSGNHENIRKWRYESQIERTKQKRPDLYRQFINKMKSK